MGATPASRSETSAEPGPPAGLVSPVLVGRAAELESLAVAVLSPPAVAVLTGEAGVGKSRLIAELLAHPDVARSTVLTGRGHRIREPFPLGPLLEAVQSLGDRLERLRLSPVVGALRPLLPELADWLSGALEPLGDAAAERHRVFRALAEVLAQAGRTVLVLDDLHWADDRTLEFLGFLLSRQPDALSVVVSYRADEAPGRLRTLTARLPPPTARARIDLRPLDERATGQLAAAILGTPPISPQFASHLSERTGGIPFAIEEVLAALQERDAVERRGQLWARRTLEALEVPGAIRDTVLERAGRLSAGARAMAEAAAVLRVPVPEGVLRGLSRCGAAALSEALASGLLQEHRGLVGFRHVLAAQAVEEDLPGPYRRELHARAADALAGLEPPLLGQLAHHLRRAGRLADWAACAEQAADQAMALGDDITAAGLLTQVLRDAPLGPGRQVGVAQKLARAALYGVTHDDALEVLQNVLDADGLSAPERGELRRGVAQLLAQAGDEPAAYAQFRLAVAELAGRPASQARTMAALAVLTVPDLDPDEQRGWADRALAAVANVRDPVAETVVLGNRTVTLLASADPAWRDALPRLRTEPASPEHRRLLARVAHSVGITACFMGHLGDASNLLEEASRHLQQYGYELTEHALRSAHAVLDFQLGRWDGLAETVEALCGELVELPVHRVDMAWVAGYLRLARGDLAGAHDHLDVAMQLCGGLTSVEVIAQVTGTLARLYLARDDAAAAVSSTMPFLATVESRGLWPPAGPAVYRAVDSLIAAGELTGAAALCGRLRAGLTGTDAPAAAAALHAGEGALAEATGDPEAASRSFLAAADAYAALPCPYEAAQVRERAAACQFATGDHRASATVLAALAELGSLGATWDAARAARLARRHGVTLPVPYRGGRRGYGSELSPRERDVARLAADGLSNTEIAAKLFLSTRTVEKHVSRALGKLGVATRRDLRHLPQL